ncbi:2-dehydropantoate 2-reductase N-terminal domain-containing protein [Mangrovicoccus ximenensis]|uniref:2-dehydropantoate 2-reductase N-terminal domain-containing protein n=1 Tax=Mangrovicoccus ximenensis TaxID=1911570 RepID=UPI0011AE9024|nr:2-dehydropantoate 2-reductase N-terminal domain-containing protein [Mangrovicoccus ximenensis]
MASYRIAVPGGGSAGLLPGGEFSLAGAEVTSLVRGGSVANGLAVSGLLGGHRIPPGAIRVAESGAPDAETLSCGMLPVAAKAHDLAAALRPDAGRFGGRSSVLLLQNGLGTAELARSILGGTVAIYPAEMMIGMARRGPAEAEVRTHAGPLRCGAGSETARRRSRLFPSWPVRASFRSRRIRQSARPFSSRCCSTAA